MNLSLILLLIWINTLMNEFPYILVSHSLVLLTTRRLNLSPTPLFLHLHPLQTSNPMSATPKHPKLIIERKVLEVFWLTKGGVPLLISKQCDFCSGCHANFSPSSVRGLSQSLIKNGKGVTDKMTDCVISLKFPVMDCTSKSMWS